MPIIAARGNTPINEEELRAHLAALLRLENLGALLGAGASVSAGGKVVSTVWSDFLQAYPDSAQRFVDSGFIEQEDIDQFLFNGQPDRPVPNIEQLLDALEIAQVDWTRRKPTSRNLKTFRSDIGNLLRCIVQAAILDREAWENVTQAVPGLDAHKSLLQRFIGARQPGQPSPWIFTTNYDLALEWAAEAIGVQVNTGFVGIHNRTFSPQSFDIGLRNVQAKGEARFGAMDVYLAKLHGSLTWQCHGDTEYRELAAPEMWPLLKRFIDSTESLDTSLMVYPRAAKYMQTVGYLSGELFRRFSDFLARPQSCLIINGYSFSDNHINRLLKSALLNPTLQLVIFLPEFEGTDEEQINTLKPAVKQLVELNSPQVTIVGGGEFAYFDKAVTLFPDPMLYDLSAREMRERLRQDSEAMEPGGERE